MSHRYRATDHRALVLAAIHTHPSPTMRTVLLDCLSSPGFAEKVIQSMIYQLNKEGLVVRGPDRDALAITPEGLEWLQRGRFDRELPRPHERPGARRRKSVDNVDADPANRDWLKHEDRDGLRVYYVKAKKP